MTVRAILFDKDGTLLDFARTWGPATLRVLEQLAGGDYDKHVALIEAAAIDPQTAEFAPHSPIIAGSSADYGVVFAEILKIPGNEEFFAHLDRLFAEFGLEGLVTLPGAVEEIARLGQRRLPLGIATNDSQMAARQQMERLGLMAHLGFIAGYDSGFGAKPGPGMIDAFIKQTGLLPAHVAVIGDSLHDLHAARAAGAIAVAVTTGLAPAQILAPHADLVASSLALAIAALGH